jgi:hypothetical protein
MKIENFPISKIAFSADESYLAVSYKNYQLDNQKDYLIIMKIESIKDIFEEKFEFSSKLQSY